MCMYNYVSVLHFQALSYTILIFLCIDCSFDYQCHLHAGYLWTEATYNASLSILYKHHDSIEDCLCCNLHFLLHQRW